MDAKSNPRKQTRKQNQTATALEKILHHRCKDGTCCPEYHCCDVNRRRLDYARNRLKYKVRLRADQNDKRQKRQQKQHKLLKIRRLAVSTYPSHQYRLSSCSLMYNVLNELIKRMLAQYLHEVVFKFAAFLKKIIGPTLFHVC